MPIKFKGNTWGPFLNGFVDFTAFRNANLNYNCLLGLKMMGMLNNIIKTTKMTKPNMPNFNQYVSFC